MSSCPFCPAPSTRWPPISSIPERYGIRQSVGDTVGPGGFVRAMRAIPMLAEIARAISEHCPDAYVCNLTNPMSVLTGTLYKVFPEIRAWGECHEVTKLRHIIAWLANRKAGRIAYTISDVEVNVLGINHFTFVDRAVVCGVDMMPDYLRVCPRTPPRRLESDAARPAGRASALFRRSQQGEVRSCLPFRNRRCGRRQASGGVRATVMVSGSPRGIFVRIDAGRISQEGSGCEEGPRQGAGSRAANCRRSYLPMRLWSARSRRLSAARPCQQCQPAQPWPDCGSAAWRDRGDPTPASRVLVSSRCSRATSRRR